MSFSDNLIDRYQNLWNEMLSRPFLQKIGSDKLQDSVFETWLKQDYEFVKSALPFLSGMKPKAPAEHLEFLTEAEMALHEELELFRDEANKLGVRLEDVSRNLTTQSYIQHLIATSYREDYPVILTVYWTAEQAYHESWRQVLGNLSESHRWYPFVENWGGDDFRQFVDQLRSFLDDQADHVTEKQRNRMETMFEWTVRYEIAFWDMAYGESGDQWITNISV